jgi:hypothetical protein
MGFLTAVDLINIAINIIGLLVTLLIYTHNGRKCASSEMRLLEDLIVPLISVPLIEQFTTISKLLLMVEFFMMVLVSNKCARTLKVGKRLSFIFFVLVLSMAAALYFSLTDSGSYLLPVTVLVLTMVCILLSAIYYGGTSESSMILLILLVSALQMTLVHPMNNNVESRGSIEHCDWSIDGYLNSDELSNAPPHSVDSSLCSQLEERSASIQWNGVHNMCKWQCEDIITFNSIISGNDMGNLLNIVPPLLVCIRYLILTGQVGAAVEPSEIN